MPFNLLLNLPEDFDNNLDVFREKSGGVHPKWLLK